VGFEFEQFAFQIIVIVVGFSLVHLHEGVLPVCGDGVAGLVLDEANGTLSSILWDLLA